MKIQLDNYRPLRELVFEAVREAIIEGQLKPGERLMEIQLAERLGVSRTPVREAIRKLELEGFVVMIPRKGAYVADISLKDIADVFEIRGALEGLAAQLAAERASDEELERLERLLHEIGVCVEQRDVDLMVDLDTRFHDVLYTASRNQRLGQILSLLREQIQRFRTRTLANPQRMKVARDEHQALVEALAARDPDLARRLAEAHIESAENSLMSLMSTEQPRDRDGGARSR
ncbi:MAG TPA: GntR family transcriptional regulator [Limnochordia bacterium]|nr:GntR family transcriptional regulator [Limnochordia bacterium]